MTFIVTRHSAVKSPADVLSLLGDHMPARRGDVLFSKRGNQIQARLDRETSTWMTQHERIEIGREAVIEAVGEICERSPHLKLDWFAVSPAR